MSHYQSLVRTAMRSIINTFRERTWEQLSVADGLIPKSSDSPSEEEPDYVLVTWLVILERAG